MRGVVKNSPWCLQGLDEGEPRWSELPGNTFLLNFAVFHVASTRAFGFRARRPLLPVRNSLDQRHIKWHFVLNIFREVCKVKTRTETPRKTVIEGESFLLRLLRTASLCVFHVSDKKNVTEEQMSAALTPLGNKDFLAHRELAESKWRLKKHQCCRRRRLFVTHPTGAPETTRTWGISWQKKKKKGRKAHSSSGFGSITRERN